MKLSDVFSLALAYREPEEEHKIAWKNDTWLRRRLAELKKKEAEEND